MTDVTRRDRREGPGRRARWLTYVLGYDALAREATTRVALDRAADVVPIGRAARDDAPVAVLADDGLRVADEWASRRHATLERRGDGWLLRDAGSANGTYVNGARIDEHALVDHDLVELGHALFVYRDVDARAAAVLERAEASPPLGPTRTHCPEMAALSVDLARVARSRESVLVLGETGAGKELVAAAVHAHSGRRGAYVAVDCGAVPDSLFEGTFFGHRRGAFTGAVEAREGEIARADGGTLFLDEVANMSAASQGRLLRAIEDGRFTPLGAPEPRRADVRWVAAANRDLFDDPGDFRPDLLRRLAGYVARVPPLRRRREDLGVLAAYLLRDAGATRTAITVEAGRRLFSSAFDGNVRELRAVLRAALLLADGATLDLPHLGEHARAPAPRPIDDAPRPEVSATPTPTPTPTREALEAALRDAGGNVTRAARALETYPKQLYRWAERLGVDVAQYRR